MKKMYFLMLFALFFLFLKVFVSAQDDNQCWRGDSRWRLGIDEPFKGESYGKGEKFFNPLYLYNKIRFYKADKYNFGFVFRKGEDEPSVTLDNLSKYYLIKYYFKMQNVFLDKIIVGTYKLQYNQGLVFYYLFDEISRPVKIKASGIKEDTGTNPNTYFSGIAGQTKYNNFDFSFFYSNKLLDASLNSDGTIKTDLEKIKEEYGYINTAAGLRKQNTLREQLIGGRIAYNFLSDTHIGVIAYQSNYTPRINPPNTKGEYLFRGDRNTIYGADFATHIGVIEVVSEFAKSHGYGGAYLIQPMFYLNKLMLWGMLYKYDKDYYNPHSSAATTDDIDDDVNEKGIKIGLEYKYKKLEVKTHFDHANHPYKGGNLGPTNVDVLWFETRYKWRKNLELYFRRWNKWYEEKTKINSNKYEDLYQSWKKTRIETIWKPFKKLRFKTRYEYRIDTIYDLDQIDTGFLVFEDVRFQVNKNLTLQARFIYFDAPAVYVSEIEPLWQNTYVLYYWNTKGTGSRYYLMATQKLTRNSSIWIKYENTRKTSSSPKGEVSPKAEGYKTDAVKIQYDVSW